jgi:hypothetical protein
LLARVETPEVERHYLGVRVAEVMRVTQLCYRIAFGPSWINALYVPIEKVRKIVETERGTWVIIDAQWAAKHGIEEEPE